MSEKMEVRVQFVFVKDLRLQIGRSIWVYYIGHPNSWYLKWIDDVVHKISYWLLGNIDQNV